MRIARFRIQDEDRIAFGVADGSNWCELRSLFDVNSGTGDRFSGEEVQLLAPVAPPNVIAIGLNYREHAEETGSAIPERPVVFLKATSAVIGPGTPIRLPALAPSNVDIEAELAIVIGKTARNIDEEEVDEYVLGYTCGNDVSARDCQLELDVQWARGKSFDTFCPLGPWIETELDPDNLGIRSTIDGTTLQKSRTSDMIFPCRQLVSFLSRCMTLLPGTVILSGTPPGVGMARHPPVYLEEGNEVAVAIEGVGTLVNPVES
ncbi:MAG: fumarylacetoacetate hydrolase family protein [Verrucomicrobiota bacterium]